LHTAISDQETEFIIIDSSSYVGGVETLIVRLARFLKRNKMNVTLLYLKPSSFVRKELSELNYREVQTKNAISYMSRREIELLKESLESHSYGFEFVLAPYYSNLQLASLLPKENTVILNGFFHASAWVTDLSNGLLLDATNLLCSSKASIRKKTINHHWLYQQDLLRKLDCRSANWFMSDLVKKYHEYYYDVELPNSRVIPLPFDIPEIDPVVFEKARKKGDVLKVVWLGRFEYFKNPSIKKTYEALQELIEKHLDLKVEFDLIGYGREKYEKDIRKGVKTSGRLQVKYLGKIFPDKLPDVISQYDVGVAMGTSALHIGAMGIPTIHVDGSDEKHYKDIKGCWLHKEPVGLGSGVYENIAGYKINGREDIKILFEEIIAAPELLEKYGVRDRNYVIENYDENKIMPQIIDAWTSSTFSPGDMEVYRHPPLKRFIRRTAKRILRR